MPFFFILIGLGLVVIGYRGTQADFFTLLKGDVTGPGNFFVFALGIFLIGLLGYVPKLKGLSNAFMGLVIVVMILANKGFFNQLMTQIQGTQTAAPAESSGQNLSVPSVPAVPGIGVQ